MQFSDRTAWWLDLVLDAMAGNSTFQIADVGDEDREWIRLLILQHWGAEFVVAHGVTYHPHELPGLLAVNASAERLGLLSYCIENRALEVVTLDSVSERSGVGTALLSAAKERAVATECRKIWLITTNDNMDAIRFYQKRGYRLVAVHLDALKLTRRLKPSLPERGIDDIPLRDEIELELALKGT